MRKNISFLDSRFLNGAAVLLGLAACGWTVLNILSVLLAGGAYQAALQAWGVNFLAGGLAVLAASLAGKSLKLRFVRWCGVGGLLAVPFFRLWPNVTGRRHVWLGLPPCCGFSFLL